VFLEALEVPGGLVSDCSKLCGEHPRPAGARVSRKLSTPLRVSCAVDHEVSFVTCSTADQGGAVLEDMWLLLTSGTFEGPGLQQVRASGKAPWQSCFEALQSQHRYDIDNVAISQV
jgi:hypothetical protein